MKTHPILTELGHWLGTALYFAGAVIGLCFFIFTEWVLGYNSDSGKGGMQ